MSICIWQLEIIDNETHENIHSMYFFTRRGARSYGAKREKYYKQLDRLSSAFVEDLNKAMFEASWRLTKNS